MNIKSVRKIVKIDEAKCNGCGECIPSCAEGAIKIINGKAKLVSDKYCDGLGACLGECPQGAITIEERLAEEFLERDEIKTTTQATAMKLPSMLGHWPVQLTLVPPKAPFLQGADVVIAADCVPFTYADFHREFLKGHSLLIACPKLDDFQAHLAKLTEIFKQSPVKSLTVVRMEVPCCGGLTYMVKSALQQSDKDIPIKEATINIKGDIEG